MPLSKDTNSSLITRDKKRTKNNPKTKNKRSNTNNTKQTNKIHTIYLQENKIKVIQI